MGLTFLGEESGVEYALNHLAGLFLNIMSVNDSISSS